MGGKKNSESRKIWKVAGEAAQLLPLPPAEEQIFKQAFMEFRDFFANTAERRCRENYARVAAPLFLERFPEKESKTVISALAELASFPMSLTWSEEDEISLLTGAALWLLDHFDNFICPAFDDLLMVMPDADLEEYVPVQGDITHSRRSILQLVTILRHRREGSRETAREIFRQIFERERRDLRAIYCDATMDYFGRFMEVCERVRSAAEGYSRIDALSDALVSAEAPIIVKDNKIPGLPRIENTSFARDWPSINFLLQTPLLIGAPPEAFRDYLFYRRSAELLSGFSIPDPFKLCAAYLLLEHEEDVLANLNILTSIINVAGIRHLPWGQGISEELAEFCTPGTPDYSLSHAYVPVPASFDLPVADLDKGTRLSDAQLFFLATGYALPLNVSPSRSLACWFMTQGMEEGRARELSTAAMMLFSHELALNEYDLPAEQEEGDGTERKAPEETAPEAERPTEGKDQQVERLTRQNKELRSALHDAEVQIRKLRKDIMTQESRAAQDGRELAQLRNALYLLRSGEADDKDETPDPRIELPARMERRVLIFGGHESWLKEIRTLLPGARFFERESLPDRNAIRGGDVLWLQTNAMPHQMFFRVLDVARKYDIPVRYFAYASARKCAEQVAANELLV